MFKEKRAELGISIRAMAEMIGKSPSLIQEADNGKVSSGTLLMICIALEMKTVEMFTIFETLGKVPPGLLPETVEEFTIMNKTRKKYV